MYKTLNPGMIGIQTDLVGTIELAARHGFAGADLDFVKGEGQVNELGVEHVRRLMAERGVRPGAARVMPIKLSDGDAAWAAAMAPLPRLAELAAGLGFTRTTLVVLPFHETLAFDDCFAMHIARLREAAPILAEHGIALGVEYVAPKTRRAGYPHAFIHDLAGTLRLLDAANQPNVGLLLDSFHWHCAGETAADLRRLAAGQVVVVHVNDAVADRPTDEQQALDRELPGASGVIELDTFIEALRAIGYDGPVTCEPANKALEAMPDDAAAAAVSAAMDQLLAASV